MNLPFMKTISNAMRNQQINNDVVTAKRFVLLGLDEGFLQRLCIANGCSPRNKEYSTLTGETRSIKVTKSDYVNSLASNVSTSNLLRQIPESSQKELKEQLKGIQLKWKLDEYSEVE